MVSFTKFYSDATTTPNADAVSTFDVAFQAPAGHCEQIGIAYSAATASVAMCTTSVFELLKGVRATINGEQVLNMQSLVSSNSATTIPRISAAAQATGGQVSETGPATGLAPNGIIWFNLGINLPVNTRIELQINWGQGAAAVTSSAFAVWGKYGTSDSGTIIGSATSVTPAANSQTQVSVKVPNMGPNATLSAVIIQSATAQNALTSLICKPTGDYAMNQTILQSIAASGNSYYFYDASVGLNYQVASNTLGMWVIPLYNLKVTDGSVTFLMESSSSENYTFTPVMSIPSSGSGENTPKQTAKVSTSGSKSILSRAEE